MVYHPFYENMPIKLACSTLCLSNDAYPNLYDKLAKIKEIGFDHVDLATFEDWQDINPSWLASASAEDIDKTVDSILSSGLHVCAMNSGTNKRIGNTDADSEEILLKEHEALISFAEKLSCPIITVQPSSLKQHSFDEAVTATRRQTPLLAKLHEGKPVGLTLEGHKNTAMENPSVALDILKSIEPQAGITYDNSHYTMQDLHLRDTIDLLDFATHVHVRTSSVDNMQAPYPNGCDDIEELIDELTRRDYQGAISIEYFGGFDDDLANLKKLKAFLEERCDGNR